MPDPKNEPTKENEDSLTHYERELREALERSTDDRSEDERR